MQVYKVNAADWASNAAQELVQSGTLAGWVRDAWELNQRAQALFDNMLDTLWKSLRLATMYGNHAAAA